MNFDLQEAIDYYRRQGAPGDQNALRNLLTEIQEAQGGAIPQYLLPRTAEGLGVKESFLLVPCMRQCGKGPNLRFDGRLYNGADEQLLARLMDGIDK